MVRRSSSFNTARIDAIYQDPHVPKARLKLHFGDLTDSTSLNDLIRRVRPHEVYNLGAQSHVRVSFDLPIYTTDTVAMGTLRMLGAVREFEQESGQQVRFYQASSSEQFGKVSQHPQNESTPFHPRSPYACAKVMAHHATVSAREGHRLHASCGVLFNHESPRRGETFVTRKITRAVGRIKTGLQDKLYLGNLDAKRDWGYAGDYVKAMWMMLQMDKPDDYVIATGRTMSVRQFADMAFTHAGMDYRDFVAFDPRYLRPAEVEELRGDASKARDKLGWQPTTTVEELVKMMVEHDVEIAQREKTLRDAGHKIGVLSGEHDHPFQYNR
jgi:GDPmannose 4,6-dehydratase